MAANPGSSDDKPYKTEDSSQDEDKLDIYSDKFDPLAFLQSDKVKVPRPTAKVFDNIAMWHTHYQRGSQNAPKRGKKTEKAALPVRRWLPHQMPVVSKRPQRVQKNIFTRMESMKGPLAQLTTYMEEKIRIKVMTRNEKGVRGYCNAYLLAFDKHWNLVLSDIDEVWFRSIKVKKSPLILGQTGTVSLNRVRIPKIETKKVSKNTEECRRHVDQMLMRGEHVILVCKAESTPS